MAAETKEQEQEQGTDQQSKDAHHSIEHNGDNGGEDDAAKTIQRNYRGYRSRREVRGCGISAAGRWHEVLNDGKAIPSWMYVEPWHAESLSTQRSTIT